MSPFAALCDRHGIPPQRIAAQLGITEAHVRAIDAGRVYFGIGDLENAAVRIGCTVTDVRAAVDAASRLHDDAELPPELADAERLTNELWLRHRRNPLPYLRKLGRSGSGTDRPRAALASLLSSRLLEQSIAHLAPPAASDEPFRVRGYQVHVPPIA